MATWWQCLVTNKSAISACPVVQLMSAGPMSANGAADRIVETVQSLYEVNMNRSFVIEQYIMAVSDRLSVMGGQSLSSEAQSHWWSQLQGMEMQKRSAYYKLCNLLYALLLCPTILIFKIQFQSSD